MVLAKDRLTLDVLTMELTENAFTAMLGTNLTPIPQNVLQLDKPLKTALIIQIKEFVNTVRLTTIL